MVPLAHVASLRSPGDLRFDAYEWCANYAAPASLVAGAVIASFYELSKDAGMELKSGDRRATRMSKKLVKLLLMSAFSFEILCVFITTVTGTMLLSDTPLSKLPASTAMGMLRRDYEMEYLACRLCFLQGLLNWLAAIAIQHAIPQDGASLATRRINQFVSSSLTAVVILMLAFYNDHSSYNNYTAMLFRFAKIFFARFYGHWPPRIMPSLALPAIATSIFMGWRALTSPPDRDDGAKSGAAH